MNNSPGLYNVNGKHFSSKISAFLYASSLDSNNTPIDINKNLTLYYYDEVWEKAILNYKHETDITLEQHYKVRAQQIRDNYDYLILNFSGGADSTTILETFINNNIKLDEVYVRWPKKVLGTNIYTPNTADKNATNMLSEWDYSIYPKLEWLRVNHPQIKIVVDDWIDSINTYNITDDLILKQNNNFGLVNYGFSEMISESTVLLESKGKRVANIFGIDKPMLTYVPEADSYYTFFTDVALMNSGFQHAHGKADASNRVNFYYAIDYPQVAIARAHKVALHIKNNNLSNWVNRNVIKRCNEDQLKALRAYVAKISDILCYPSWDINTFQVDKDLNINKLYHPWFHYIYNSTEFDAKNERLKKQIYNISHGIKDKYRNNENGKMVGLKVVSTKLFRLNV